MKNFPKMPALSVLSGILIAFSFPNVFFQGHDNPLFFLMWAAYVPLFYVLVREKSVKLCAYYALICHAVFFVAALYWLKNVKPMGGFAYLTWFVLAFIMALHGTAAAVVVKLLEKKAGISTLFSLPAVFMLLEFVREHLVLGGFPLLNPAQTQQKLTFITNILPFTGTYGVMFLIYAVNGYAAYYIAHKKMDWKGQGAALSFVVSGLLLFSLAAAFIDYKGLQGRTIKALILQPDVDQDTDWNAEFRDRTIGNAHSLISRALKETGEIYDVVVWPESSFPDILNIRPEQAVRIAAMTGNKSIHITGADRAEYRQGEPHYFNTAYAISRSGEIISHYSKHKLVPFGEYIPLQDSFTFIKKVVRRYGYIGFTKGTGFEPLDAGDFKIGAMICYDSLFPEGARAFANKGVSVLAHLSYESWYGVSPASAQVMQNTALRAAENRMWILRSVESGISAFIDPQGRIISPTKLYEKTYLSGNVTLNEGKRTFYTEHGPWFVGVIFIALLVLLQLWIVRVYVLPRK